MLWTLKQDSDREGVLCEFCQRLYPDQQYLGHWGNCFDRKNSTFRRRGWFEQSKKSTASTNCDTMSTTIIEEENKQNQTSKYTQQSTWDKPPPNHSSKSQPQVETKAQPKPARKASSSSESSQQIVQKNQQLKEREQNCEQDNVRCPNCQTQIKYSLFGAHQLRCYRQVKCDDCSNLFPMHLIGSHMEQCPERVRKRAEASSLANQRAVIGGSSTSNSRVQNNNGNLSGLMGMMTGVRSTEVEESPLFIALQAAFIQFFEKRDKGLTETDLNELLQMMRYKQEIPQGDNCVICLDSLDNQQTITKLPCKHLHHENCIKKWLKKQTNCPLCKGEVKPKEQQQSQEQKQEKPQVEKDVHKPVEEKKQGEEKQEKQEVYQKQQKEETIYDSQKAQQTDAETQAG